jgi:hypothetical protein
MVTHVIYNDWVDLRAGEGYGRRFHGSDYKAAIHGYIERAPVGVWPEGGSPMYIEGFAPTEIVTHLLDHQAGMLTWVQ